MDSNRSKKMTRYASIDIGTNTILMVIGDILSDGRIITVSDFQRIPRIGKYVDKNKNISADAIRRLLDCLNEYLTIAQQSNVEKVFAVGTSALRKANNADEVLGTVYRHTKLEIELLAGEREAELTFLGAISSEKFETDTIGVLDIGGGSTELTIGTTHNFLEKTSLDIGCVQLTERFFPSHPPSVNQIKHAEDLLYSELSQLHISALPQELIGVAGTVTTLAALDLNLDTFDAKKINGHILSKEKIENLKSFLLSESLDELRQLPQISPGREDILLAGIIILLHYLEFLGIPTIRTIVKGLRYGKLVEHARKIIHP